MLLGIATIVEQLNGIRDVLITASQLRRKRVQNLCERTIIVQRLCAFGCKYMRPIVVRHGIQPAGNRICLLPKIAVCDNQCFGVIRFLIDNEVTVASTIISTNDKILILAGNDFAASSAAPLNFQPASIE